VSLKLVESARERRSRPFADRQIAASAPAYHDVGVVELDEARRVAGACAPVEQAVTTACSAP